MKKKTGWAHRLSNILKTTQLGSSTSFLSPVSELLNQTLQRVSLRNFLKNLLMLKWKLRLQWDIIMSNRTAKIIIKNKDNVKFWRGCGEALLEVERYKWINVQVLLILCISDLLFYPIPRITWSIIEREISKTFTLNLFSYTNNQTNLFRRWERKLQEKKLPPKKTRKHTFLLFQSCLQVILEMPLVFKTRILQCLSSISELLESPSYFSLILFFSLTASFLIKL